jgi:predicted secreted Zn-dependent protease
MCSVIRRRLIILFALTLSLVTGLPLLYPQPLAARPAARSAPAVKISYQYYPIAGTTASELRSQMNRFGPHDEGEDRRYDARTDWRVQWSYRYGMQNGLCAMQQVNTQVGITFTLPQWKSSSGAGRSLVQDWQRYMASLQLHEDGHKDHGVAAAQDVQQTLRQLPHATSCAILEANAKAAARAVIQTYNAKDLEYDHTTRHGYTQGAVFPTTTTVSR